MAASIVLFNSEKTLYIPVGYAARQMLLAGAWTKLNVGVRVNFKCLGTFPRTVPALGSRFWFGVGAGTTNPLGVATPAHFIGYRSSRTQIVEAVSTGFIVGWSIASVKAGVVTVHETDTHVSNKVMITGNSDAADIAGAGTQIQAIYLQFEQLSEISMKVTILRPPGTGGTHITEAQFVTAVDTETLDSSIAGHSTYETDDVTFAFSEATNGTLNAINLMTNIADQTSGNKVASIRWNSVRATKFA